MIDRVREWFKHLRKYQGPNSKRLALIKAWQLLRDQNPNEFEIILTDLVDVTGYYRRPGYAEWMARTRTPEGFELHSALSNARAEVVQHIMGYLTLSDEAMIALERAARAEQQR